MKRILTLLSFVWTAGLITSCSKSTPTPSTNNGTTGITSGTTTGTTSNISLSIDPSFKAPTGFSSSTAAIQADGKIVIDAYSKLNNQNVIKIYRLNSDGSMDNSFNIDVDKSWIIKTVTGLFILADGRILVGGEFTVSGKRATVIRLTSTGALDYSYASPGNTEYYYTVAFQRTANAKVFVSYTINGNGSPDRAASIIRLNSDGSLDSSFSLYTTNVQGDNDSFSSIVPLINGKIFVAGIFSIGGTTTPRQNVARLNDDGTVDATFNFKETINSMATVRKIAVQSDGKVIIAGNFTGFTDPTIRDATYKYIGYARLNADGSIDQSFTTISGFSFSNYINDIVLLSNDRILANWLGISSNNYYNLNYLELVSNNGGIDASFNFQYQYNSVVNILKETTDQFLLIGSIAANGITYPIIRYKKT